MDSWLQRLAALDGFDLPILSPKIREAPLKRKLSIPNSAPRKTRRSEDGMKGTRHLTVEQRHELLEPLGHFNFEEFSQSYPTICEADYHLSLALENVDSESTLDSSDLSHDSLDDNEHSDTASYYENDLGNYHNIIQPLTYVELNVLKRMETVCTEDSPEFLDSLVKNTNEELKIRSGKSQEHLKSGRIEQRVDAFFNREAFDKIHSGFIQTVSNDDPYIRDKSAELKPLITTKSFSEMHSALVDFLYKLMIEIDALYVSMYSVYTRSRSQSSLADVTSDIKRIRKLKVEHPVTAIKDILSIYKMVDRVPECVSRLSVTGEVVKEAMRRIGADNYGPTSEFAAIIENSELSESLESESESDLSSNDQIDNSKKCHQETFTK